jgi:predicted AAA+ superfamily ATPase
MADDYIPRVVDSELDELVGALPAISIQGPRAVGKTETARRRAQTIHRLDDPAQRQLAEAAPNRLAAGEPPILIDEWQRVPESWDVVRRSVDDDMSAGRFLLTGSQSPMRRPTHSGAGRIVTLRMRPLGLCERLQNEPTVSLRELLSGRRETIVGETDIELVDYVREIVRSGFPGIRHLEGRALRAQLDGYISRIVDVDFVELDLAVRKPAAVRRWMAAYAAATATTSTYETIRDAATSGQGNKPAKTTTIPYRDILERLWILDAVPAWLPTRNQLSRLSKPPKHHLADPALAARLLGADEDALLSGDDVGPAIPRDGLLLGHLFESLVTLSVRVCAQACEARVFHLRTQGARHEVDLIVERADHRVLAIEVKLGRKIDDSDVKHLNWLERQLGDDVLDKLVVYTGPTAYRREDGIAVVPAALLGV